MILKYHEYKEKIRIGKAYTVNFSGQAFIAMRRLKLYFNILRNRNFLKVHG